MKNYPGANVDIHAPLVEGETRPYRYPYLKPGEPLVSTPYPGVCTMYDMFHYNFETHRHLPVLGMRAIAATTTTPPETAQSYGAYEWQTYEEVNERMQQIGRGLLANHQAKRHEYIGIYSSNTADWLTVDIACASFNFISVPLYDTLGVEALRYIIHQTGMRIMFVSRDRYKVLAPHLPQLATLTTIILMDRTSTDIPPHDSANITTIHMSTLMANAPATLSMDHQPPCSTDIYTICYTSGTTGLPKGVILTHGNVVAEVASVLRVCLDGHFSITGVSSEVHLSYLPLAHMLERAVVWFMILIKSRIGFFSGNVLHLMDDVHALKPTFFVSVPRLLNRMHTRIIDRIKEKSGLIQTLFQYALAAKLRKLHTTGECRSTLWDALVFSKLRELLGGRVKGILSGAAPANGHVLDFLSVCFSCPIIEGYGQTETCAGATIGRIGDATREHVGFPLPCNAIKLVDIPEMNYRVIDQPNPRGEICFQGPNVFTGYFGDQEQTRDAIRNGWLHSGDVGMVDRQGRIIIIDRKKNLFKLAQGEYVAPEKIELIYSKSDYVSQVFVHGDPLENNVIAIVVPELAPLLTLGSELGLTLDYKGLCEHPRVRDKIMDDMLHLGKQNDLKGFEQVRAIHLESEPFPEDCFTPTFKLKRPQCKLYYRDILTQLYQDPPIHGKPSISK